MTEQLQSVSTSRHTWCLTRGQVRPYNYHDRTAHILPQDNNLLQYYISDTEQFTNENKMIINKEKTKIISFTKSRKWDFPPELHFSDGTQIEYIADTDC